MLLTETTAVKPLTPYGADKCGCEQHGYVATTLHGVPTTGLRLFNVYGPGQNPDSPYSGVISVFCNRLVAGKPVTIDGDGHQVRDFIHVGDVVRVMTQAMATPSEGGVFNVCTGTGTTVLKLAETITGLCGATLNVIFRAARRGDVRLSVGELACAEKRFGIHAEMQLKEGLMLTLASERARPAARLRSVA